MRIALQCGDGLEADGGFGLDDGGKAPGTIPGGEEEAHRVSGGCGAVVGRHEIPRLGVVAEGQVARRPHHAPGGVVQG